MVSKHATDISTWHKLLVCAVIAKPFCAVAADSPSFVGGDITPNGVTSVPVFYATVMDTVLALFDAAGTGLGSLLTLASSQSGTMYWVLGLSLLLLAFGAAAMIWTARTARQTGTTVNSSVKNDPHFVTPGTSQQAVSPVAGDDMRHIYHAVLGMQRSLAQIASGMRESNEAIACAASEIAASVREMSAKAEARATRLEQTAVHIEKLAAALAHNNERTRSNLSLQQVPQGSATNVEEIAATATALRHRAKGSLQAASAYKQTAADDTDAVETIASVRAKEWDKVPIPEVELSNEEIAEIISQTWHESGNKGPPPLG